MLLSYGLSCIDEEMTIIIVYVVMEVYLGGVSVNLDVGREVAGQ
jgi:hypothetical protein